MNSLASEFRSGNSRRAKWEGRIVHSVVQFEVKEGDTLVISRMSSSPTRAQALKLAVDKGDLRANGILASTAAVWTHTSPETATLEVVGRKARSVDIWNSWSFDGVDSSWLGNAGMLVESQDSTTHILRCSDGVGDVSFDGLVVKVEIRRG